MVVKSLRILDSDLHKILFQHVLLYYIFCILYDFIIYLSFLYIVFIFICNLSYHAYIRTFVSRYNVSI